MSGLVKAKKYDWKDSNMALFGSDVEKKVKKSSAQSEPAWKNSGAKVGVEIWRINKFKVEKWPTQQYGQFFNGDSYIILNTYKATGGDELLYDVHFWIGSQSTQDEYCTAAYKTVELDTFHDDKPIQHREVEGHESALFKSYFKDITILKGGCDSGFHSVQPTAYQPRLFQVRREGRRTLCTEIPMKKGNLNSDDVFIIDLGLEVYQYNGVTANKDEKYQAAQKIEMIKSERPKVKVEVLEESAVGPNHPVMQHFKDGASKQKAFVQPGQKAIYKLSDESGKMEFTEVCRGKLARRLLDSNDVFIVDTTSHCFVFIGERASVEERRNAFAYAHNYLKDRDYPFMPITVVGERQQSAEFDAAFL